MQRAHRTVGDALAAQRAIRLADGAVTGDVDGGTGAGAFQIPDVQALDLIADLHAAHALDALGGIPDQGEILVPGLTLQPLLKGQLVDVQIAGNVLQRAVAVAETGGALAVVLGKDQLHGVTSVTADRGAVGVDHHALFHHVVAGGDQPLLAFQLHHAHAAGGDLVDFLQKAKLGDCNVILRGRLHDGRALGRADGQPVNCQVYHTFSLPPLNRPKPK